MKKNLSILLLLQALLFTACGNTNTVDTTPEANHEETAENLNTVSLTEEQMNSIGITFGTIEDKQLTASLKTNGILQVPNQNKANINSVYSGVVKSLQVQPGNSIRKGAIIATISNPEFIQAQSDYLGIAAKIVLAKAEVKRQTELNAGNAGALKNLQAAETQLRTLQTAQTALEQQLKLMGINPAGLANGNLVSEVAIRSPINGVVSNVAVKMGSYIDLTTTVAEIVDNSQLHLDLFVYEKDLSKLKNNQLIHFTLTNNPGKEYDAQIYSLGSSFEGESKAVTVHAKVQGDKTGLIDGMNITAVISLEKATVPAVPTDAIVTFQGQDYIFIRSAEQPAEKEHTGSSQEKHTADHTGFERIPIAKGTTDVGYTEITLLKEISPAAQVVIKGAFFVLAKMTNSGEHEH